MYVKRCLEPCVGVDFDALPLKLYSREGATQC